MTDHDFNPPSAPPCPNEYRQAQARAASIPPHELRMRSIEHQRERVMQCSVADLAHLRAKFMEALSEPERRFYGPLLECFRPPTRFIVFAYPLVMNAEASR